MTSIDGCATLVTDYTKAFNYLADIWDTVHSIGKNKTLFECTLYAKNTGLFSFTILIMHILGYDDIFIFSFFLPLPCTNFKHDFLGGNKMINVPYCLSSMHTNCKVCVNLIFSWNKINNSNNTNGVLKQFELQSLNAVLKKCFYFIHEQWVRVKDRSSVF